MSYCQECADLIRENAALRQRCELLEANLHVQGEYLAGALADVERAERDALRWRHVRAVCEPSLHFRHEVGDSPSLRESRIVQVDWRSWDELDEAVDKADAAIAHDAQGPT